MTNNKPLSTEEKLQITEALRRGNLSHREIARQFKRSQSTVSQIARYSGITPTHKRRRTPAAKDVEGTYSREERVNFLDRILGSLAGMVDTGGLTPREAKEVASAAKVALDARRAEDPGLEPEAPEDKSEEWVDTGMGGIQLPKNNPLFADLAKELESEDFDLEEKSKERAARQKAEYDALREEGIEQPWRRPNSEREEVERALAEARIAARAEQEEEE